jgi:uncharacterized membrane protein YfcA
MLGLGWAPLAGALVGLIVALTGVGGGALMALILLFGFGFDLVTVVATDLLFATLTKIAAGSAHSRSKRVDWEVAKRMWWGSIPASLIVVILASFGVTAGASEWISRLLGLLILLSGLSLLLGPWVQYRRKGMRIQAPAQFKRFQPHLTSASGFVLGTLVSLTSIGAGALGAIFLRALYPLRMEAKRLVATDTIHAVPVSFLAGLGYLLMGHTNVELLGLLLGSIPAALLGIRLMANIPSEWIKRGLAIALIGASFKLIY